MGQRDDLMQATISFLKENNYPFEVKKEDLLEITFHFPFKALGKMAPMKELVLFSDRDVRVIGVMPFSVPEAKRNLAAEYLMRVNYHLQSGWFSMDYNDGEVRATAERSQMEGIPSKRDMQILILTPTTMVAQFSSGLLLTIRGVGTPKENAERFTPQVMK